MIKMNFTFTKRSLMLIWAFVFCMGAQYSYAQPANAECADADVINVDDVLNGTLNGVQETNVPAPCTFSIGEGVWYVFSGTGQEVTVSVDDSAGQDTELTVYSGSCAGLTIVDCSDDPEEVTFQSVEGTNYYIYVSDWASNLNGLITTDFTIAMTATPPPPSVCDDAAALELVAPVNLSICDGEEVEILTAITGGGAPPTAFQLNFNTATGAQDFTTASGIDLANPTIVADAADAPLFGSFTYIGDVLYGVFDDGTTQNLITIDTETGATTVVGPMPESGGFSWFGMSYDVTSSTLYAIGGSLTLNIIDPATGAVTVVADLIDVADGDDVLPINFAIDANGNAYGHDFISDDFYSINLATGGSTVIGDTGLSSALSFQGAAFAGSSYVAAFVAGGDTEYYIYDLTTGEASLIATLEDTQITGIAFAAEENADITYSWSPALGLSNPTIANPIASPSVTTTYTLTATDACGQEATADVLVEVTQAVILSDQLNCKGGVNVSLDADCRADLTADRILAGTYACAGLYGVDVDGTGSSIVTSSLVGQTVDVQVFVPGSDPLIYCWGTILVEDKLAPMIECEDIALPCTANTAPAPAGDAAIPTVIEPCGDFTLDYTDATIEGTCADAFQTQITRTWTVTNASGMSATCTQTINIERAELSDISAPVNYDGIEENSFLCTDFPTNPGLLPDADGNLEATRTCYTTNFELPLFIPKSTSGNGPYTFTFSDIPSNAEVSGIYVKHADDGNLQYIVSGPNGGSAFFTSNSPNPYSTTTGSLIGTNPEGDWNITINNQHYDTNVSELELTVKFKVPLHPEGAICGNINFGYNDTRLDICDGTYKILRIWQVLDWCAPGESLNFPQVLKVEDKKAPTIEGLADIAQSTDFDLCTTDVILPAPTLSDDCSSTIDYSVTLDTPEGTLVAIPCVGCGYLVQGLPIGTHTVTYTATDDCGNESTESIDIVITDDVIPTAVCETNHVVNLHNIPFDDNGRVPTLVDASVFDDGSSDNCGILKYEARRMISTSPIDFDWTARGYQCNSDAECVGASTPDNFVRWWDKGEDHPSPAIDTWYCKVPFSCEDLGSEEIMIEFRVTDVNGNYNTCMVNVTVHDKVKPVISCPENVTIECHDDVPPVEDFLSANPGTGLVPAYRVLQIVGGFATYTDDVVELIGYYPAVDNCDAAIYIREVGAVNNCGVGNLSRIFQAEDQSGNMSSTCLQVVSVINSDPFLIVDTDAGKRTNGSICTPYTFNDNEQYPAGPHSRFDDVEWPCDVTVSCTGADDNTHPDNTGRPMIMEDACDQVSVEYFDWVQTVSGSQCELILRTWKVLDICQFQEINGVPVAGYWEYTQTINVNDTNDPVFDSCDDVAAVDADPNNCLGLVGLTKEATDACTATEDLNWSYTIDPNNDGAGPFITGIGNDATGNYPIGGHSIKWKVEDKCGNVSFCTQLFYVVDNAAPNLVVITSTDVSLVPQIGGGGSAELWATELDLSSFDNCSGPVELVIQNPSLGLGQTSPPASAGTGTTFDCDDMPFVNIDLWGRDQAGNWAYVIVQVIVEDNNGLSCSGTNTAAISGAVTNEGNESVENVTVSVSGTASAMPGDVVTSDNGEFAFDLEMGNNYSVAAARNDNPLNGISTYDLILMSQHILGINKLDSPYKMIAADINQSGTITAFDMVELRKLILFINTEFTENTSWRFVDANHVFADATNPFAATFPEVTNFNDLDANMISDFLAIKVGDLNGSAKANELSAGADTRTNGELAFNIDEKAMTVGSEYTVEFKANEFQAIAGYQFTLNLDQDLVEFVDVNAGDLAGLSADNFGFSKLNEGVITTSWNAKDVSDLNDNDVVFSLTLKAKSAANLSNAISLSSRYTNAEAYNGNADLMDVVLEFNNGEVAGSEFALYQNQPNPFKNETTIGFELPEASAVNLTIYDVAGRTLKAISGDYAKGYNQVTINRSDLNGAGVLYYQLDTKNDSATKKMILVD